MGSVFLTVFGTVAPMAYNMALVLFVIGFFCLYVPLHERKKKAGGQNHGTGTMRKKPSPPMSWPKALGVMALCVLIFTVGMTLCIACAVMGEQLMALVGAALCGFALWGMVRAGRDFRIGVRSRPKAAPPAKNAGRQTIPSFQPEAQDHQHIAPSGLDAKARLEQLDTLKEAGLVTEREYEEKRKEILREL